MPNFNQQIIIGHVGRISDVRKTMNTVALEFSVAVKAGYAKYSDTDWFSVECYGKTAEAMFKMLTVGQAVQVVGKNRSRVSRRDDGTKVTYWRIMADSVLLLGGSPRGKACAPDVHDEQGEVDPGNGAQDDWQGRPGGSGTPVRNEGPSGSADDIPF